MPTPEFNVASPWIPSPYDWSSCKLCDAYDFFRPEIVAHIRAVGEEPRFHSKQWEYAQLLETVKRLPKRAGSMVGLGCGCEPTISLLAAQADKVVTTDLYGMHGAWKNAHSRPDTLWPALGNLEVHPMDMRHIDLPKGSFDFVWSICAVEHVGDADAVVDVVRKAGELLAPGGRMFLSTEFTFDDAPFYAPAHPSGTLFLDKSTLRRLFTETGLHLVEPLDLRLSTHPLNVPVWDQAANKGFVMIPCTVYRAQPMPFWGTYGGCVSLVLSREDLGHDRFVEDPDQRKRLAPLWKLGREVSRRLTLPTRWW